MRCAPIESPAVRKMRQAEDPGTMGVETGVERSTARTALWSRAKTPRESHARGRQPVQRGRSDSWLTVTTQVLAQVVAGQEENVIRQAAPTLSP